MEPDIWLALKILVGCIVIIFVVAGIWFGGDGGGD